MTLIVDCPNCKKQVIWNQDSKFRPFCSERCRLIDLGDWAEENHKISQPMQKDVVVSEEMLDALEAEFVQHNKFFVEPE
ncbi:DNA gyrase inhibitor YacG [Thalassotalea marina]|uniref:DNA gyrase inhibitor YacG n=1 Tax=Thalassotalea marina TaxID=1673741 RepID=A0A919BCU1_9GAMM|nr:DNA gyrase inhibitor YacG [Thalassotalea marina]GHF79562.1 DNA gyrase inhibitor YacG [Thalassotalea marina]